MALAVSELESRATPQVETRYRRIRTPIPVPQSMAELRRLRAVEPRSMAGMPPVLWDQAQGFLIRDPYGNQWIDLTSGIVVANVGHAHPRILRAVREQLDAQLVFSYAFPTTIRRRLLERLAGIAPEGLDRALTFSSGTEATECALILMRKHGLSLSPEKKVILSFEQGYHGRTLGARLAGGGPGPVDGIRRGDAAHVQLPLPGSSASRGLRADLAGLGIPPQAVAGILFESIPGLTTTPYPQEYVEALMEWAKQHRVVVAVDEIQCGMGRTGRMFAFEHYGMTPDLIACGKGLSSSLPVSAVIGRGEIMDLAPPGEMSSTFGGNPVCMAAALANLEVIEEERLVERAAGLGEELGRSLTLLASRHRSHVRHCDGRGLFYSIHLRDPRTGAPLGKTADEVVMECVRRGVMLFPTGRGMIKITPPLVIERDALLEAVDVLAAVMDELLAEH
jgi:4-aminobutyrate aminotransferase / (S)-3-amino-2-methylpropionate transaminase / 5-aminovalerate transaminase